MSYGMASEKRCGIATTGEHLFHSGSILSADDDEDMSALSRVWWQIVDQIEYATSVGLAILHGICCPEPRTATSRRCDVAFPAAMIAPWLIVQRQR
jgi:hypothetical protein